MNELQTLNGRSPALDLGGFAADTPLTIAASDATITLSVRDVLKWIAPEAPQGEALKFLLTCRSLRLNPFAGEAYLVPMGGAKWGTIIAKAGYLKRAQQSDLYDGFEAGIICQLIIDARAQKFGEVREFPGACVPRGWIVIGGWCRVYKKGVSRPFAITIGTEYYKGNSDSWQKNSPTMYRKVAVAQAHREAFAIGDSYDDSEAPEMPAAPVYRPAEAGSPTPAPAYIEAEPIEAEVVTAEPAPAPSVAPLTHADPADPETLDHLRQLLVAAKMDEVEVASMLDRRGVRTGRLEDLDEVSAQDCIRRLNEEISQFPFAAATGETTEGEVEAEAEEITAEVEPEPEPAADPAAIPAEAFRAGNAPRREPKAPRRNNKKSDEPAPEGEPANA